jgi:hypothetical protein
MPHIFVNSVLTQRRKGAKILRILLRGLWLFGLADGTEIGSEKAIEFVRMGRMVDWRVVGFRRGPERRKYSPQSRTLSRFLMGFVRSGSCSRMLQSYFIEEARRGGRRGLSRYTAPLAGAVIGRTVTVG